MGWARVEVKENRRRRNVNVCLRAVPKIEN